MTDNCENNRVALLAVADPDQIGMRPMTVDDISAGMRLSGLAGWNQTQADWELFLQCSPVGGFVAVHNGLTVGTVLTFTYGGGVAWIGMVLVDPNFRRRGIGSLLLNGALAYLAGCPSIKLDATPAGKQVYDQLGFSDEYGLHRATCSVIPQIQGSDSVRPLSQDSFDRICDLDLLVFGADRRVILQGLLKNAPESAFLLEEQGSLRGFCLGRSGSLFHQIGPVVAETLDDAKALLSAAFCRLTGRAVVIDVPDSQPEIWAWLETLGFIRQRPFMRMYCQSNHTPGIPARQYAIAGPELG